MTNNFPPTVLVLGDERHEELAARHAKHIRELLAQPHKVTSYKFEKSYMRDNEMVSLEIGAIHLHICLSVPCPEFSKPPF